MAETQPSHDPVTTSSTPSTPPTTESKAQREARLRRERRNAKLQGGGADRLSKITSLSGRPAAAQAELEKGSQPQRGKSPVPQQTPGENGSAQPGAGSASDPAEVDLSTMLQSQQQMPNAEQQQRMFREMLRASADNTTDEPGARPPESMEDDPMVRMMQQMLGSMGGDGGQQPGEGLPPGLADMFGGGQQQQQEQPRVGSGESVWRIVHFLTSMMLSIYAVTTLSFTGSSLSRSQYVTDPIGPRLFWMFATAEVVLQSTRYFLDGGRLPQIGLLGKVAGFLPEPYANYIRILQRYGVIYTTIVADALVVVFVLGCVAWWKGLVEA